MATLCDISHHLVKWWQLLFLHSLATIVSTTHILIYGCFRLPALTCACFRVVPSAADSWFSTWDYVRVMMLLPTEFFFNLDWANRDTSEHAIGISPVLNDPSSSHSQHAARGSRSVIWGKWQFLLVFRARNTKGTYRHYKELPEIRCCCFSALRWASSNWFLL